MPPPAGPFGPTRALGRAVLVIGVLVLVGVVLGRLDLVAIAAPFALATAWGLRTRPHRGPVVELDLPEQAVSEADAVEAVIRIGNPDRAGYDLTVTRVDCAPWVRLRHGDRPFGTRLGPGESTELALTGTALRWGYQHIGPATAYAVACDGLLISARTEVAGGRLRVHPQMPPFRADDAMPQASALVGIHRSHRAGDGGELAGVRRYGPGDRLRRVDWRVTLRSRELHIAHTLSDRDAEVVILLDVLHEAGDSDGIFGAASVLDTTVRAAAAIAEHYLRHGDRVAMIEYSGHPRQLRAASGRRHIQSTLEWLLHTRATQGAGYPPSFGIGVHLVPASALVVVLTPLVSGRSAEMIATLARAGRVVVAVDTLGGIVARLSEGSPWTDIARRLWWMHREHTIGQLREVGVPVTAWGGTGSLDEVLRDMTRLATAPRIALR